MRQTVAGPVKAARGQTVSLHVALRRGEHYASVVAFSRVGEYEPSPHVPLHKMDVKSDKPEMMAPTSMRLTEEMRPQHTLELKADEDCEFFLMQEVDTADDKLVKARILCHDGTKLGKFWSRIASAFRWIG